MKKKGLDIDIENKNNEIEKKERKYKLSKKYTSIEVNENEPYNNDYNINDNNTIKEVKERKFI